MHVSQINYQMFNLLEFFLFKVLLFTNDIMVADQLIRKLVNVRIIPLSSIIVGHAYVFFFGSKVYVLYDKSL